MERDRRGPGTLRRIDDAATAFVFGFFNRAAASVPTVFIRRLGIKRAPF
jgi:hypothetical protein